MKYPPNNLFSLTNSKPKGNLSLLSISRLQRLKSEVSEHLSQLHQGVNLNQNLIEYTLSEVAENIFALAYLGLDEQGLKEIDVLETKIRLQGWLEVLRSGTTNYQRYLSCFVEEIERVNLVLVDLSTNEIKRAPLTLADFGTNRQKLREYEILGFKLLARLWIERIAAGEYNAYFVLINIIREQVIAYEITLADINTDDDKLKALMVFAAEKEALSWLKHLRASSDRNEFFLENLRIHVEIGGFPLKKIGTDEEELQMLLARIPEPEPPETKKSKSSKISGTGGNINFFGNLFNNDLFFKVFLKVKESAKQLKNQNAWVQTFFSRLHVKVDDWNLFHHQH